MKKILLLLVFLLGCGAGGSSTNDSTPGCKWSDKNPLAPTVVEWYSDLNNLVTIGACDVQIVEGQPYNGTLQFVTWCCAENPDEPQQGLFQWELEFLYNDETGGEWILMNTAFGDGACKKSCI